MDGDVRVCICHFTPEQYTKTVTEGKLIYNLKWDARPNPPKSVQVQLAPITPGPSERTFARAAETVGLDADCLRLQKQPSPQQLQPLTSPASASLLTSLPASDGISLKRSRSPTHSRANTGLSLGAALSIIKRQCREQSNALAVTTADLDAAGDRWRELDRECQKLRAQLAEFARAATTLFEMYQLEVSAHLATKSILEEARKQAGLPWPLFTTDIAAVSYERLCKDPRFRSNVRAMTGFWSVETLDAFFDVCIGFSDGVLPCRYTPGKTPTGRSTATLEEHRNFCFFVLYLLRTGAQSFMLAGILFGFDQSTASLWYTVFFSM